MTDSTMSPEEALEIRGRLILWSSALHECSMYLKLLSRTEPELSSSRFDADPQRTAALQAFLAAQPDHTPGQVKLSHLNAFEALNPTPYPSFSDCYLTTTACKLLVVVLFCQLLTQGNRDEGRVARNSKAFVAAHLERIVQIALESQDRKRFSEFCEECIRARDKMIGHADGTAFEMTHGEVITSHKLMVSAVDRIDFEYMRQIVEPLRKAVDGYTFNDAA